MFSHNDADGIGAASVLTSMLVRAGKGSQTTNLKSFDLPSIQASLVKGVDLLIVADMGSSNLTALESLGTKVIVLDHHRPEKDSENVIHLNPSVFKVDGARYACASTLSMLLAVTVDESNWNLLPMAFAGMVGDRQHLQGLIGVNAHLYNEGSGRNLVQEKKGSLLPPGPVGDGLMRTTHPFKRGVSGDPQGIARLLQEANVRAESTWDGLDEGGRRRLSSLISLRLLEQGCSLGSLEDELAPDYFFPQDNSRAYQLTRLINACGRVEETSLGLAMLLGVKEARERAETLLGSTMRCYERRQAHGGAREYPRRSPYSTSSRPPGGVERAVRLVMHGRGPETRRRYASPAWTRIQGVLPRYEEACRHGRSRSSVAMRMPLLPWVASAAVTTSPARDHPSARTRLPSGARTPESQKQMNRVSANVTSTWRAKRWSPGVVSMGCASRLVHHQAGAAIIAPLSSTASGRGNVHAGRPRAPASSVHHARRRVFGTTPPPRSTSSVQPRGHGASGHLSEHGKHVPGR